MDIKEELVRIITKDGATFLLGAPLPQPVDQEPEPVKVINIELLQAIDGSGDDVFRIVSKADKGSHYEREGLAIVTTVPYSEATRWDSVVSEKAIIEAINEARLNSSTDNEEDEDDEEGEIENGEGEQNDKNENGNVNTPIIQSTGEIKK